MSEEFRAPERRVKTQDDVEMWLKSKAYHELLGFLATLNTSVRGKSFAVEYTLSDAVRNVTDVLDLVLAEVDTIPLEDQQQRFGNRAFKTLGTAIVAKSQAWLEAVIPEEKKGGIVELKVYFDDSFGNFTRIDYGTGHEINFLAFCCCLYKIGLFSEGDHVGTVFHLFRKYLSVMRRIQLHYKLEPAGSQGVWGLDDYQFIPFIFGSSQLIAHPSISPGDFVNQEIVAKHHENYMFLGCIKFINDVKRGPFAEHSNQLWNISAVKTWTKVNQGLIKMYKAEVLCKQPVIQHFQFGSLLPFEPQPPPSTLFSATRPLNLPPPT